MSHDEPKAMYKEARVLPHLAEALQALDYPAAKLDIKLVLEADDAETIAAARALHLPPHFEIVVVPDGTPRTKPRALNYALQFATGDYIVIYDAEDRPDPDQLRKAAGRFHEAPADVACLQARLTFDNASENWLAKQFAIEYASLFAGILPMLDAARLPLPLGGTSYIVFTWRPVIFQASARQSSLTERNSMSKWKLSRQSRCISIESTIPWCPEIS